MNVKEEGCETASFIYNLQGVTANTDRKQPCNIAFGALDLHV